MSASALPLLTETKFSVADPLLAPQDVQAAAELLLSCSVLGAEPVRGGGNNRLYRIRTHEGHVALKLYPSQENDLRDRLGVESAALRFLERYSVSSVPRMIVESREANIAAMSWMDGESVNAPDEKDVDSILRLVAELRALSMAEGADHMANASAAVFSAAAAVRQVEERLLRLKQVTTGHPDLEKFLSQELRPVADRVTDWVKAAYDEAGIGFDTELVAGQRVLSPSDFGFHNARRRPDGRLGFVDFEYFGWDDPAKLVSDFLLHAGMDLPPRLKRWFLTGSGAIYGDREGVFAFRLHALFPLFALCWVLILLNEYLPERWARRTLAHGKTNGTAARAAQLERARARLSRIAQNYDSGPDVY